MYEAKHQPLLPRESFYKRIALHVSMAIGLLGFSLGMGPVNPPVTSGGKFFAGWFALYAGLVFIVCAALVLTPLIHRVLHHFHVNEKP